VSDWLHIRSPVAELYEETLIVFQPVRRPRGYVVEPVRVVVLKHFPHALLEVGRGDDYATRARQPRAV
jgi:hypothetical protein